ADAGHAPFGQHRLRPSYARPRAEARRGARSSDGDSVEARAGAVDRARRECVSPLELASAYATLADGGVAHEPSILTKVVFPGGPAAQASKPGGRRVVDETVAAVVTSVLAANVQSGTGAAAALSGRPAAGKTGTTDSFADAWFAGWVPQLTTVTWVGYP